MAVPLLRGKPDRIPRCHDNLPQISAGEFFTEFPSEIHRHPLRELSSRTPNVRKERRFLGFRVVKKFFDEPAAPGQHR
jgi:hypothetical protein